ncbi:hypothetical protein [Streptomyces sp. NPDC040750]|uniref:hypothetical protein n=1 Tax=Streptomyces sp. NPDC040750 TaxID=3154491 RepID=UPI0033D525B6
MTDQDAAREHTLHDDGDSEHAVHARIAQRLAAMSDGSTGGPPPPYARRHLARHAQIGGVLDDARVPPQALVWDTGTGIRGLLAACPPAGPRHWLTAWSVVEPYLRDASLVSRLSSLQFAYTALHHARTPQPQLPSEATTVLPDCPLAAVWTDWQPASNVLAVLPTFAVSLALLPDSDTSSPCLVIGTTDGNIHFLDIHSTLLAPAQAAHTGEIRRLRATDRTSQGRQYLVSASTDGTTRLWDAHHQTPIDKLTGTTWIDDAALYQETDRLSVLVINGRSELLCWSPPDPAQVWHTAPPVARGALATVTDDKGTRFILHAADELTVFTSQGGWRASFPLTTAARSITPAADRPGTFYCGHADGSITTWSVSDGQLSSTTKGHGEPVKDLIAFTLDGRGIVAATCGPSICLWEPQQGTTAHLSGHWSHVTALTALTNGPSAELSELFSAATDATLRRWPADLLRQALARPATEAASPPVAATRLQPDGPPLAAAATAQGINVWDVHLGQQTTIESTDAVLAVTWAQRGTQSLLLWSDTTKVIHGHDIASTGAPLTIDSKALTRTMAACHTPAGTSLLLGAGDDYRARLWDLHTGSLLRTWQGHELSIKATAAAADQQDHLWLATGGTDGTVRLWDPQQDRSNALLPCDQGLITALAIHPEFSDGLPPFLATAGDYGYVRLWDLHTHQPLPQQLLGHSTRIHALTAFTAPNRHAYVAAATHDGVIHIWHVPSARCILQTATGAPVRRLDACAQPETGSVLLALSGDCGLAVISLNFTHPALTQ